MSNKQTSGANHDFSRTPVFAILPFRTDPDFRYQKKCLQDCINRGEMPISPATYIIGSLRNSPIARQLLTNMWAWLQHADYVVVYSEGKPSDKMMGAIEECKRQCKEIKYRTIQ